MPSVTPIFPLRLVPELRNRAEGRAAELGLSLNALVAVALDGYLGVRPAVTKSSGKAARRGGATARNAPCPCGSRKKFKRCCGRTD